MATGRSNTELKVFLNGDYESQYSQLSDTYKEGSVFFDKTRRAVYAEGVLITSDVVDVKVEGSKLMVKKVGESTYKELADLAIPNVFVKFTENQGLTPAEQRFARANIGVKDAVDNLTSTDTTAPLSAAQGKELKRQIDEKVTAETGKGLSTNDYTDEDKDKLGTIARGAQVNKISSFKANNTEVGGTGNGVTVSLSGNLVDSTSASSGKVDFNLSMWHDSTNKKIHFFNLPKEQATATNVDKALFSIDTTDFVKDSFVESVTFNSVTNDLVITFVLADGSKDVVNVELDTLMNVYKAGNGIVLDGDTFKLSLGDGVKVEGGSLTLSLGNGLSFDTSGKLKVDFESNGVTSINSMGGGSYTIMSEGKKVGTNANELKPIEVITDSAAKKIKINAKPAHMLAQFFHENNADATSGIRAKGVKITEDANGNPYSMLMDFTPKVWSF